MRETEPRSESPVQGSRQQRRAHERSRKKTAGLLTSGAALATLGAGMAGGQPAAAATFQVDNLNDSGAGSLRQAIVDANTAVGADVITFQAGLTGTITLTSGELYIQDSVDVQGPGAAVLTVSGNNSSRVFYLYRSDALIDVIISGLTITEGTSSAGGGVTDYGENLLLEDVVITGNAAFAGGGVAVSSEDQPFTITVRNSTITNNAAYVGGGLALYLSEGAPATVLIQGSVISGNDALYAGAGIFIPVLVGEVTIETSTISGNDVEGSGGGLWAQVLYDGSTLTVRESTISGNTAIEGGGLGVYYSFGSLVIENTTISGNQAVDDEAGDGGGVLFGYLYNNATIRHSTIVGNSATGIGGGIFTVAGSVDVENTIIGDNTASADNDLCGAAGEYNLSFSLVEDPGSANINDNGGNIFNQDPQLGALQDNGGPTETHKPALTSPVVGAGDPAFAPPPATDQRGLPREVPDGGLEMGAVELQMGTVQFSLDAYSINENGGTAKITVTRTGGSDGEVTVEALVSNGTATTPADYTVPPTCVGPPCPPITWADGDSAPKTFQITIVDDLLDEPNETVNLVLSNPQGGAAIGSPGTAVLTIIDNDEPLTIAQIPTLGDAGKTLFAVLAAAAGYITLRRRRTAKPS